MAIQIYIKLCPMHSSKTAGKIILSLQWIFDKVRVSQNVSSSLSEVLARSLGLVSVARY
jgi:hypothetical protein